MRHGCAPRSFCGNNNPAVSVQLKSVATHLNHGSPCPSTGIAAKHAIAHNKIRVIDEAVVVTGSFNFTTAAEAHNAENLLVIRDAELAAKYLANWQAHLQHSQPYETARRVDQIPMPKQPIW
jgi:phosphatidylserine/phosphatidylglycerophosphate/cardiolipin synthase-like enzyme